MKDFVSGPYTGGQILPTVGAHEGLLSDEFLLSFIHSLI